MTADTETSRMRAPSYLPVRTSLRRGHPPSACAVSGRQAGARRLEGATASLRSLTWTRSLRTATRRSSGSPAKQRSQSVRPSSSSCIRSPGSGVRRQPSHAGGRGLGHRCCYGQDCGEVGHANWVRDEWEKPFTLKKGAITFCLILGDTYPSIQWVSPDPLRRDHYGSILRRHPRGGRLLPLRPLRIWGRTTRARRRARLPRSGGRPLRRASLFGGLRPPADAPRGRGSPDWLAERAKPGPRGRLPRLRGRRPRAGGPPRGRVDSDRAEPVGPRPLRRPDRLAPARPDVPRRGRPGCWTTAASTACSDGDRWTWPS